MLTRRSLMACTGSAIVLPVLPRYDHLGRLTTLLAVLEAIPLSGTHAEYRGYIRKGITELPRLWGEDKLHDQMIRITHISGFSELIGAPMRSPD